MRIVAANLTSLPVIIDRKGHQLGGGEFAVVDTDDRTTAAALAAGNLGEADRPENLADASESAAAAFRALDDADATATTSTTGDDDKPPAKPAARKATS